MGIRGIKQIKYREAGHMKGRTEAGEMTNHDVIRQVLREHSGRENLLGITAISRCAKDMGYTIKRTAIVDFMAKMNVKPYETEEECDELLRSCSLDLREVYFCKTNTDGRRTRGYWMMEMLSDSEWMYLIDSVIYSKMFTKKEADNLAKRITLLAGKRVSDLTKYRYRMEKQPYFVGDEDIDEKIGHVESQVLKRVHLIREAINLKKKVKFNLCVYDYGDQKVRLVPYGKNGKVLPETPEKYKEDVHRVVSPYEVIFSNGRYYMLGADLETERNENFKYKLYRIDLMDDLTINRAVAITKEEAGIQDELKNLYEFRLENPYLFAGKVEKVRIRVNADQFTQIVDWFADDFKVIRIIEKESDGFTIENVAYYDIDVKVNLNSFTFWVLQYSGCVEVVERNGDNSFRKHVKKTLEKVMEKYED